MSSNCHILFFVEKFGQNKGYNIGHNLDTLGGIIYYNGHQNVFLKSYVGLWASDTSNITSQSIKMLLININPR